MISLFLLWGNRTASVTCDSKGLTMSIWWSTLLGLDFVGRLGKKNLGTSWEGSIGLLACGKAPSLSNPADKSLDRSSNESALQ